MKDSFASRCFGIILILLCCLSVVGLVIGGRIPFLPSNAIRIIAIYWIPALMAGGWLLTLAFHRDTRDSLRRRKLIELYAQYGGVKASLFLILSTAFFYLLLLTSGDGGISKSAAFLSRLLPSKDVVFDLPFHGVRYFSGRTSSLQWVKITNGGHVDEFSFPASRLTFLPCPNDTIQISGSSSWAGVRVNYVECGPRSE